MEKSHIEREEGALQEEESTTETAIASQSSDIICKREEAQKNYDAVGSEIEMLEKTLEIKRMEHTKLRGELRMYDSRVVEVRKKYDRQLQRIHDRRSAVNSAKHECEVEETQALMERQTYEERVKVAQQDVARLREWCCRLDAELPIIELVNMSLQVCKSLVDFRFIVLLTWLGIYMYITFVYRYRYRYRYVCVCV